MTKLPNTNPEAAAQASKRLSDDGIDTIIVKLTAYLEENCVGSLFDEDEIYTPYREFVFDLLSPYSTGERNYN